MKTSNKLLTGLLIAVFLIPLGIMMAFNQMIKEGDYTTTHSNKNSNSNRVSGKTGHYSVVKITVPYFDNINSQRLITCHLHSANDGHYSFTNPKVRDSLSITNERDTLFIKYLLKKDPGNSSIYYYRYNINLYLPDMKNIVVHHATLRMDSIEAAINPEIGLHLTDAVLQLGDGIDTRNRRNTLKDIQESDLAKTPVLLKYTNLAISADSSQLLFGYHLQVDSLSLKIGKGSKMTIAKDFQASQINGSISNQTTITSDFRTIKTVSGLSVE